MPSVELHSFTLITSVSGEEVGEVRPSSATMAMKIKSQKTTSLGSSVMNI